MKRKVIIASIGISVLPLVISVGCLSNHRNAGCRQRGDALNARVAALKREAHNKLKIGTKKDAIIRFFSESGMPATFNSNEASGTTYTSGCAPSGCGSDAALLGLRVKVDDTGTVVSEPIVGAIYTNCL
jgi:hypothetical protein